MERTHGSLFRAMFAQPTAGAPPSRRSSSASTSGHGRADRARWPRGSAGDQHRSPRALRWPVATARWQVATTAARSIAPITWCSPCRRVTPRRWSSRSTRALGASLATFEYAGLAVVALGYRAADVPRPLDGYGYLTTRPERLATLGVVVGVVALRRPRARGHVLLRVMLGGSRRPDLVGRADDEALRVARAELQRVLGVRPRPRRTSRSPLAAGDCAVHARATRSAARASARMAARASGAAPVRHVVRRRVVQPRGEERPADGARRSPPGCGATARRAAEARRRRRRCMSVSERRHVVLVTYGEPPTPSFVDQLAYSWRILLGLTRKVARDPGAAAAADRAGRGRAAGSRLWPAHGYGSPLEPHHRAPGARACGDALAAADRAATGACTSPTSSGGRCSTSAARRCPAASRCGWCRCTRPTRRSRTRCRARRCGSSARGAAAGADRGAAGARRRAAGRRCRPRTCSTDGGRRLARPRRGAGAGRARHAARARRSRSTPGGRPPRRCAASHRRAPRGALRLVVNGWLNHTRGGRWTEPPIEAALARGRGGGLPTRRLLPLRVPRRQRRERARRTDRAGRPSGDRGAPPAVPERLDAAPGGDRRSGAIDGWDRRSADLVIGMIW